MILISIIVPVYNVAPFVERCITSIIEQENCGASIECIIVDDCSPDNSMDIIHSLLNEYTGCISFVFIEHKTNMGLSTARNSGINIAKGDFLFFIDSDDWLPLNSFSTFVSVIKGNPDIDMIVGNHFNSKENTSFPHTLSENTLIDNKQLRSDMLNNRNVICSAWNKMISARFFAKSKNRFQEGIIFEDIIWTYLLFMEIKQTIVIPDVTYVYESNNPNSISNKAKERNNVSLHMKSVCYIGNAILNAAYKDLFAESIFYFFDVFIIAYRLQYENNLKNEECRESKQLRNRLVLTCFKKGRWFLAFYIFTLAYPPTSYFFYNGWFRRHYYIIEKAGRKIAFFLERVRIGKTFGSD